MFAEAVVQVFLVAIDGGVGPSKAVSGTVLESSWFGKFKVSWVVVDWHANTDQQNGMVLLVTRFYNPHINTFR